MNPTGNTRNGKSQKTLKGDFGELPIEILAIATAVLNRKSLPNTNHAGQVSMTRSSRSMRAA